MFANPQDVQDFLKVRVKILKHRFSYRKTGKSREKTIEKLILSNK